MTKAPSLLLYSVTNRVEHCTRLSYELERYTAIVGYLSQATLNYAVFLHQGRCIKALASSMEELLFTSPLYNDHGIGGCLEFFMNRHKLLDVTHILRIDDTDLISPDVVGSSLSNCINFDIFMVRKLIFGSENRAARCEALWHEYSEAYKNHGVEGVVELFFENRGIVPHAAGVFMTIDKLEAYHSKLAVPKADDVRLFCVALSNQLKVGFSESIGYFYEGLDRDPEVRSDFDFRLSVLRDELDQK